MDEAVVIQEPVKGIAENVRRATDSENLRSAYTKAWNEYLIIPREVGHFESTASKDGLVVASWPPSNANLQVQFLSGLENILLTFDAVRLVFQERVTATFELIIQVYLAPMHLIDRPVEILDQMIAIMDQCGVAEQLYDPRNEGLPHVGSNGLDFVL